MSVSSSSDPAQTAANIRAVTRKEDWASLKRVWDELLHDSTADVVFLCWAWMDCWVQVYGDGGRWLILIAEDESGRVIGIAPMMIDSRRGVRHLMLFGQKADTASEYLGWILRRGFEESAGAGFCRYLQSQAGKEWDLLSFDSMLSDSPTITALRRWLGSSLEVHAQTTAPFVRLPPSWEDFLASKRAKFRQRWTRFHRDYRVEIKLAGRDMSVSEGLAKLRQLNEVRWGADRQSFLSERYLRFHEAVAQRLHESGHLLLIFLEADGEIIAGRYDFVYGGKGWSFQGGWLPEWEKISAGKLILTAIMQWCCEHGIGEYDFLGGKAGYKDDWSEDERRLVRLEAENPRSSRVVLHRLLQKAAQIKRRLGL